MKLHVNLKENGYDIVIEHGILSNVKNLINLDRKVCIITDSGVPQEYAQCIQSQCKEGIIHVVEQGEEAKSFPVFIKISELLLQHKFSRKDCIIAVGGGVVGDLAGFAAATYMRGIDFVQIPTTTLSQIDSSIGGKVAINLHQVKNIVGAFYQPKLVVIDPDTLLTLPRRHFINGLVEAIKAGLIYDASLFEMFEQTDINKNLDTIIYKALCVKKDIVEQDEKEENVRKTLNFGHTIGHAIESYFNLSEYLHGECVAMGMLYFIDDEDVKQRLLALYDKLDLPSYVPYDNEAVYDILCRDKKADDCSVTIVHVKTLGQSILVETPLVDVKKQLKG